MASWLSHMILLMIVKEGYRQSLGLIEVKS